MNLDSQCAAMHDIQIVHVEECTSAKASWVKLRNLYHEPSTANKMRLYEEFLPTKLDQSSSVGSHLEHLLSVRSQLRSVGINIEDSLYKLAMLRILSRKYENLVVTLKNQIVDITVEDLHSRIYREESRQTISDSNSGVALSDNNYRKTFSRPSKKNFRRYYCNKECCFKSQYWKRKANETQTNSRMSRGSEQPHAFMAIDSADTSNLSWFVDSVASYHICCERNALGDNMSKLEIPKKVKLGDGKQNTANYEGDIRVTFKSRFGSYDTQLKNVIYVPQLKVNLLSVVQIQSCGYSIIFQNSECKVKSASQKLASRLSQVGTGYCVQSTITTQNFIYYSSNDTKSHSSARLLQSFKTCFNTNSLIPHVCS